MKKLGISFILAGILLIGLALAEVVITPISNPTGSTSNTSVIISYNFTTDYLNSTTYNWDNVNYSLRDGCVLHLGMNNFTSLGENDTYVVDDCMGNNGTVYGGSNISWTPNGKYGGAFNFSGKINSISLTSIKLQNYTYSFWLNPNYVTSEKNIFGSSSSQSRIIYDGGATQRICVESDTNGIYNLPCSGNFPNNTWSYVSIVKSANYTYLYKDGVLISSTEISTNENLTINAISPIGTSREYNGSIDNVMIFNKSLSTLEVSYLYQTQLTKYDSQNWTYQVNQSLNYILNSSIQKYNFNYNFCSSNLTSNVCTSPLTITQTIPNKNINASFSSSIGNIRSDFYGFLTNRDFFSNMSDLIIDSNGDGIADQPINSTFHKNNYANTNSKIIIIPYSTTSYFENSSTSTPNMTYINQSLRFKQSFDYVYNRNDTIIITWLNRVPLWLANKTEMCSGNNFTCLPNNFTKFSEQFLYFFNNITENGNKVSNVYVSFANEPEDNSGFLYNVSRTNYTRSIEINNFYNQSYTYFKSYYPTVPFGGLNTHINQVGSNIVFENFIKNFTNQIDFIAFHTLRTDTDSDYSTLSQSVYNQIYSNCSAYGLNCNHIIETEYKYKNSTVQNDSRYWNIWTSNLALSILGALNSYPQNISKAYYVWSDTTLEANLSDSPYILTAVNQIYPKIYPPQIVTKYFATYCPAGGTVYTSSSDDDTLKTVSCISGSQDAIIVINTDTNSKNVTINMTGYGNLNNPRGYYLQDDLGNQFPINITTKTSNVGIFDSYNTRYYLIYATSSIINTQGCATTLQAFQSYPILIGLIGTVFLLGLGIMFVFGYNVVKSGEEITAQKAGMFIVILMGMGITIIVGIVAVTSICSTGVIS